MIFFDNFIKFLKLIDLHGMGVLVFFYKQMFYLLIEAIDIFFKKYLIYLFGKSIQD